MRVHSGQSPPRGTGPAAHRPGRERKQQLVDCAAQLFAERGYAETRIIDIVEAAGVAKGLFYWYFENKEALFAELAADIRLRLRKHQGAASTPTRRAAGARSARHRGQVPLHGRARPLLLAARGRDRRNFTDVLRREGTEQHIGDVRASSSAGQEQGGTSARRTRPAGPRRRGHGRLLLPLPPHRRASRCRSRSWPRFVARYVVHSVAADEPPSAAPPGARTPPDRADQFLHAHCKRDTVR
jgi:AcrR family transcriptional regulator